ncbi:ATP-binding protein [Carnobacteriaceae bacterium 52-44]
MYDLTYYQYEKEVQVLDRKRAVIHPKEIANHLSAFANAEGGTLVIGIEDDSKITGFKNPKAKSIEVYLEASFDFMNRIPKCKSERLDVKNSEGEKDEVLLFHVEPSYGSIISLKDESVYLRINDKSKRLTYP